MINCKIFCKSGPGAAEEMIRDREVERYHVQPQYCSNLLYTYVSFKLGSGRTSSWNIRRMCAPRRVSISTVDFLCETTASVCVAFRRYITHEYHRQTSTYHGSATASD